MNDKQDHINTIFIPVNFILHADKQHVLIKLLKKYTPLSHVDLANLLNLSAEKLLSVSEKKDFLNARDAEKLAKYFCIFCGS
ncbi:MAG: hypothetical protein A3C44_00675 [Gammaproteobacteria bacterium RIFCSPHIGHO2_02_FULL_39_13]|nr:MAG: hypothetical protein A3C44_00675 [Gammaproteobacteria bacterium RIFCSPHIGHO2_02_FULL_39_13]